MRSASLIALCCSILLAPSLVAATPGPDSVVVVANMNVPGSVALAERYAEARDVPARQVCLLDAPTEEAIDLAEFETRIAGPLNTCLTDGGVRDRIEAAVLIRGLPIVVRVPVGAQNRAASLAAALMLWDSEMMADSAPVLGQDPGQVISCGTRDCYGARWQNAFRGDTFEAGQELEQSGVRWRPLLVTMLHGRSDEDAEGLLDSALAAEATDTLSDGEFLFMEGRDAARGVLDSQYPGVISALETRGLTATQVPFETDLSGRDLSSFFVGTATLGDAIEGNTYRAGSLAGNLTSFGARAINFRETGQSQVSIARWVTAGVAGVHGTVAEPLNNCFPDRQLLVRYVDGSTLAEAFHLTMPFVYWRNLVLGDPMAAPFAERPTLTVEAGPARLAGAIPLHVEAADPAGRGIAWVAAYLDGVEVARADGDTLDACVPIEAGDGQPLLVVARAAEDSTGERPHQPKGWTLLALDADGGSASCDALPDAGPGTDGGTGTDGGESVDAGFGADAAVPSDGGMGMDDGGCSCRAGQRGSSSGGVWLTLAVALIVVRRRR